MLKRFAIVTAVIFGTGGAATADTLNEALLAGLQKSDSLTAARHGYVAAKQSLITAQAGNNLTGTVSVTGSHTESDKKNQSGGFQSSQSFSSRVAVSKQLYDSGEADARVMSAEHALLATRASYRAQEQGVMLAIVDAYLSLLTAADARALQEENVARLKAQTQATKIRLDAGTTTATRLAEAEARLARAQSNLIAATTDEDTAKETYQSLTGLSGNGLLLPSQTFTLPQSLKEAEDEALSHHPDILSAKANERSMRAQFDILSRQVLPKLKFNLSATDSYAKGKMNDKFDLKGELVLSSPFLVTDGSRAKGKEVYAKLEQSKYRLYDATRTVSLNARSSLRSLKSSLSQKQAVEAELKAAILVADGIRAEVEFGQKIFLDQLDAEQSVSDAKVRLLRAEQAIMIGRYRLLAALGKLDTKAVGLDGLVERLEDMPDAKDVFTGFLPIADLPE